MKLRRINRRLSVDLAAAFLLLAILPVLIVNIFFHHELKRFIMDEVNTYNEKTIEQAGLQLDFVNTQVDETIQKLFSFIVYFDAFDTNHDNSSLEGLTATLKTEEVMTILKQSFNMISDIYLYNSVKLYSTNSAASRDNLWKQYELWLQAGRERQDTIIVPAHSDAYVDLKPGSDKNGREEKISFIHPVSPYRQAPEGGVIQVDIYSRTYDRILNELKVLDPLYISLESEVGSTLYQQGEKAVLDNSLAKERFIFSYELPESGYILNAVVSNRAYIQKIHNMEFLLLVLGLVMGAVFLSAALAVYKKITTPLYHMRQAFAQLSEGKFDLKVFQTQYREFQELDDSLCKMSGQLLSLMNANVRKEKEKSEAEMKALQAQINPHFLYNVLESIKWMALTENAPRIAKAIVSLVDMLEFSCNIKDNLVELSREVQFIRSYIEIQSLRYGGRIEVDYLIENKPELMGCRILKFILQPIVENAILHGFVKSGFEGKIIIDGFQEGDALVIMIADNGEGMELSENQGFSGIGITNIKERIRMNFGRAYGLNIESKLGEGTCVWLRIPFMKTEGGRDSESV